MNLFLFITAAGDNEENHSSSFEFYQRDTFLVMSLGAFILMGAFFLGVYSWSLLDEIPSLKELENPKVQLSTVVYSADSVELARLYRQHREWVPLDSISPHVIHALVATEDHRFYEHSGIDLYRTLSVPYHIMRGDPQGASTITQQLARNLYEQKIGHATSIKRKLKEMITAVAIERRFTKQEILELYLNMVPFGNNVYGINLAAHTYFNVPPDSLTIAQSATFVGMLKGTSYYNPLNHPARARQRRNIVLFQMQRYGDLPQQQYQKLRSKPLQLQYRPIKTISDTAPYFVQRIRDRLEAWGQANNIDVYTEGLVVHTTLNTRLQKLAQAAVEQQLQGLQAVVDVQWGISPDVLIGRTFPTYKRYLEDRSAFEPFAHFWETHPQKLPQYVQKTSRYRSLVEDGAQPDTVMQRLLADSTFIDSLKQVRTRLEAGFVALDPKTGHVKAWVGGRNHNINQYDHVGMARRQPGSTFKPFVYTAAIDNGYSPFFEIRDSWVTFVDHQSGKRWRPQNFSGYVTNQMYTLEEGLAKSKNTVTARLAKMVGPEHIATYARRLGINSPLDVVPSLALGTSPVTLLEITAAYGTFANRGLHAEPVLITRIEDQAGHLIAQFEPKVRVALSEETAYTMLDMMRGVLRPGHTGYRIRSQFGLWNDLFGKTGTTQHGADGWFIMVHPQLAIGAWVGFDDPALTFRSTYWGQGSHNALRLVGDFFRRAVDSTAIAEPNAKFEPPEDYEPPYPPENDNNSNTARQSDRLPREW